jgi:hypothetical protein
MAIIVILIDYLELSACACVRVRVDRNSYGSTAADFGAGRKKGTAFHAKYETPTEPRSCTCVHRLFAALVAPSHSLSLSLTHTHTHTEQGHTPATSQCRSIEVERPSSVSVFCARSVFLRPLIREAKLTFQFALLLQQLIFKRWLFTPRRPASTPPVIFRRFYRISSLVSQTHRAKSVNNNKYFTLHMLQIHSYPCLVRKHRGFLNLIYQF